MTCAQERGCDIENTGGEAADAAKPTPDLTVDGDRAIGKHTDAVPQFMAAFVREFETGRSGAGPDRPPRERPP